MKDKVTIDYYNRNYEVFSESTINVDFEYQQNKFLKYLASGSSILDLGCWSRGKQQVSEISVDAG